MIFIVLACLAVLFLAPTAGVLLSSIKTTRDIALGALWTIPAEMYWGNYAEVLGQSGRASVLRQHGCSSLLLRRWPRSRWGRWPATCSPKLPFRGSNLLFLVIVSGMFFPPQVILIPLFRLFNALDLIDTLYPIVIIHIAMGIPICTLLMRNFFATVPNALREAAILEGANEWQVLTRVALPLSLPALAVLATLQFTWIWNDFLWPLIFTQSDEKRTIMLGIVNLKGQYSVAWGVQGALSLIASLPTLVVFLFFQRYFIKGMTMGAVKG